MSSYASVRIAAPRRRGSRLGKFSKLESRNPGSASCEPRLRASESARAAPGWSCIRRGLGTEASRRSAANESWPSISWGDIRSQNGWPVNIACNDEPYILCLDDHIDLDKMYGM